MICSDMWGFIKTVEAVFCLDLPHGNVVMAFISELMRQEIYFGHDIVVGLVPGQEDGSDGSG